MDEPFVAALYRANELQPFAAENLKAKNWEEAARLAAQWAMGVLAGGIFGPTQLQLKQGDRSEFLQNWKTF